LERPAREQRSLGSRWYPMDSLRWRRLLARSNRLGGVRSGKARGNAAGSGLLEAHLNPVHPAPRRPDWTGRKHASAPRKGLEGICTCAIGVRRFDGRARGSEVPGRHRRATLLQSTVLWLRPRGIRLGARHRMNDGGDARRERRKPDATGRQRERGSQGAAAKPRGGGGWSRIHCRESGCETSDRGQPRSGRLDRTSAMEGTWGEGSQPR